MAYVSARRACWFSLSLRGLQVDSAGNVRKSPLSARLEAEPAPATRTDGVSPREGDVPGLHCGSGEQTCQETRILLGGGDDLQGKHLIMMLNAPSGVTKIAGANAYAAKFAASPPATAWERNEGNEAFSIFEQRIKTGKVRAFALVSIPIHQSGSLRYA